METPVKAFDLTPEQQDTLTLLQRLFGKAIADRCTDFCRLAAGAFDLHVARPIAAHALRELDSLLRHVLEVPMDAKATEDQENAGNIDKAKQDLIALGFDEAAIQRASSALKPRFSHKNQIRKIVTRLGLAPDGDVAKCWTSLCDSFGKAHQRSFHHSLKVDDEFRTQYQQPFETVIRAVAVALQGRYVALMRRVEELAAMQNRVQAVALFASEIPGALPLQWHFFQRLQTGDWLPHQVVGTATATTFSGSGASLTSLNAGKGPFQNSESALLDNEPELFEKPLLIVKGGVKAWRRNAHRICQIGERGSFVTLAPKQFCRDADGFINIKFTRASQSERSPVN